MRQTSRGKFNRLQRIAARSTTNALDGYGLRCRVPARPASYASYLVLVHRLPPLLHASFRPRLATKPLRFAITSPPSGCEGDLHPKAVKQCSAHTRKAPGIAPEALNTRIDKPYSAAPSTSLVVATVQFGSPTLKRAKRRTVMFSPSLPTFCAISSLIEIDCSLMKGCSNRQTSS